MWPQNLTTELPALHAGMLDRTVAGMPDDARVEALLGGGSMALGGFDEQSDLDLVVVVRAEDHAAMLANARAFAARFGSLLAAFTGEHVGEPRLLICLYGPPLLHVDFKFVIDADLDRLVEKPLILWARDGDAIRRRIETAQIKPPKARLAQWYEERAWIWLHCSATKLLRGEYFEAVGGLEFFRDVVLGAMLQRNAGLRPRGVRRIEAVAQARERLVPTLPSYDRASIAEALRQSAALYVELRQANPPPSPIAGMPGLLLDFVGQPSASSE